jgi:digeranylgeranylglycerophospholipid reductase
MIPVIQCDVLVVGAGPAGSTAAASAASSGVSTVLIDSKVRIGEQPHCGEFVPSRLFSEFNLDRNCIIQSVDSMETRVSLGLADAKEVLRNEIPSPGFMIDRVRFDRNLARNASAEGVDVFCATRLIGVDKQLWTARSPEGEKAFHPKVVIAADGALSSVATSLGYEHPRVIKGIQAEVPLSKPLQRTIIFLDPGLTEGYGWLFPKGNVANVGLGVSRNQNARDTLDVFLEKLLSAGLVRKGILARSGGVIAVSGMRKSLVENGVIFCGDAAGLTHPITGAGIPQAIFSGSMAGKAAAVAVKAGNSDPLQEYEVEIRGRYAGVINHALSKRIAMSKSWHDHDFVEVCENSWIAFKGYRKRIGSVERSASGL